MQQTTERTADKIAQEAFALLDEGYLPMKNLSQFMRLKSEFFALTDEELPHMYGFVKETPVTTDCGTDSHYDPNDLHVASLSHTEASF